MELFEFKKDNEAIICTHYLKSKLSKEAHGFKFGGQRVEEILTALGKKSIHSFKRINKNDLQINYLGGKVYIRNAGNLIDTKAFKGISRKIELKSQRYGEKRTESRLKKHPEWKNLLRHKANRAKSVLNFNKKATFSKKEQYSFRYDGNKPYCTMSGTSRLTGVQYSYTYDGQSALNTLKNVNERKITAFQLQKDKSTMEISTSKGNVLFEDFAHCKGKPGIGKVQKNIEKAADKLSQKEYNRRIKPATNKTLAINKLKSAANTGKKLVVCTSILAALFVTISKTDIFKQSYGYVVDKGTEIVRNIDMNIDVPDITGIKNVPTESSQIELSYSDRTSSEKYQHVVDNYGDKINYWADQYGLDPALVTAMISQENGYNTNSENMPAAGLMQLEKAVWADKFITAYNQKEKKMDTLKIEKDKMTDVDLNIQAGCMILENSIRGSKYDIARGVAKYNMGGGNMEKIYSEAMKMTGKTREQVIEDGDWLDYTYAPGVGDKNYLNHVFSYLGEEKDSVYVFDKDGVKHELNINNTYEMNKTK